MFARARCQERNQGFTKSRLREVSRVFWCPECFVAENGLAGDDTYGHLDDLTRFVHANKVVFFFFFSDDCGRRPNDANYAALSEGIWQC